MKQNEAKIVEIKCPKGKYAESNKKNRAKNEKPLQTQVGVL